MPAAAAVRGEAADAAYCEAMLRATGVCVVPGSGFGQREGEWHYRTTILPEESRLAAVWKAVGEWHEAFMREWEAKK